MRINPFYFFCTIVPVLLLEACDIQPGQTNLVSSPSIAVMPGGTMITPNQLSISNKNQEGLTGDTVATVSVEVNYLNDENKGDFVKVIKPRESVFIQHSSPFSVQLRYLSPLNIELAHHSFRGDTATWDIVVGYSLAKTYSFSPTTDVCNCATTATTVLTDAGCSNIRYFDWGPTTSTSQDACRITISDPANPASQVSFIVCLTETGGVRLVNSLPCLTNSGICISTDQSTIMVAVNGIFCTVSSHLDTSAATISGNQKMVMICPATYNIDVKKLTCPVN